MSLLQDIASLLLDIWESIKKTFVRVLKFFKNIVNWFRSDGRMKKVQQEKNLVANTIKMKLGQKDYAVANIFNTETNEMEDVEAFEYEELDEETKSRFGNKDMVVIM